MTKLIDAIVGLLFMPIFLSLLAFAVITSAGLLFGFSSQGHLCRDVRANRLTRIGRVMFVVAPYACKRNAGLLQPATNDLIEWLTEVPE